MSTVITKIRPTKGLQFINFRELRDYKDLLYFLVLRGIKAKYAQSILGIGWAVIQPLFTTLVFTIVFGNLAKVTSDGLPYFIFSLTGMVCWNYFSGTLTESTNSLVMNANMISKVYFPRLVLPLAAVFSKLLDFIIGMILLIIFLFVYRIPLSAEVLMLPVLILLLLMTSIGMGMLLSAMAVQYRDVRHAMTFLSQLLMYAAPVVYPASSVPEQYQTLYALNPMVGVIEGFRAALLHSRSMPWDFIAIGAVTATVLLIVGAMYFRKMERVFADVV
ncbi:MAG: ABC transporter permease [Cyclobacteriaceae bacterium]|nr:ABC transporter permease [Cyclobacteriaceae bacterium]